MEIKAENIKAIAIDLDGTVLNSGSQISIVTKSTLQRCMKEGIAVILSTGRSVLSSEPYRAEFDAKGPMVYYNGAEVVDMPQGKLLEKRFLDSTIVSWCTELSHKKNVHFQIFLTEPQTESDVKIKEILLAENPSHATQLYKNRTGLDFQFGDLRDAMSKPVPPECIKGIFIDDHEKLEMIREEIKAQFGEKINLVMSADYILEVLSPQASKGNGLLSALQCRGIDKGNVISFGDEENDLSMFKVTGFSAAPSNARSAVRDAAQFVVGSNDEDGVAVFLKNLFGF